MDKVFLKIVPCRINNESRDLREIRTVKEMGYHIFITAIKGKEDAEDYECEAYKLKNFNDYIGSGKIRLLKRLKTLLGMLKYRKKIYSYGLKIKPDIISAHNLFSLSIGYKIKRKIEKKYKKQCKIVYDSHELTTEIAGFRQSSWFYQLMVERNEKKHIRKSDAVMVVNDSIAKHNYEKYKLKKMPYVVRSIPESKIVMSKHNHFREILNIKSDKVILLYQGGIQKNRGIENMVLALNKLNTNFVLVLLGFDVNSMLQKILELAEKNAVKERVYFLQGVSQALLPEYSNSADIGLCLNENTSLNQYYCLPNKVFEYINANIPILCSDFPEMAKIVNEYGVGEIVEYNNIEKIVETINNMLEGKRYLMYKQNMKKAQEDLCWEKEKLRLIKMYLDLEGR